MAILVLPRTLDAAVSNLADVGPTNAKRLEKLGVKTIRDLLLTLPFGRESYGGPATISSLEPGTQATVVGRVKSIAPKITRHRRMKLTEAVIEDDGGAPIRVAWFNQPFVAKQLHRGDRVAIAGTVKRGYVGMLEMQNPHYERLDANEDAQPARGRHDAEVPPRRRAQLAQDRALGRIGPAPGRSARGPASRGCATAPSPDRHRRCRPPRPQAGQRCRLRGGAPADGLRRAVRAAGRVCSHARQHRRRARVADQVPAGGHRRFQKGTGLRADERAAQGDLGSIPGHGADDPHEPSP